MPRQKGKARAAARSGQDQLPDKQEQPPEIIQDPNHSERFAELGSFALKLALANHLAAAYPDAPAQLLSDLRDVNLSRHKLTQVAYRLESKGMILVMKTKGNERYFIKQDGVTRGMDTYGIGVSGNITSTSAKPDQHRHWEETMMQLREDSEPIKRVAMKDLVKGFRAGMSNYTIQSAGLNYIESGYDVVKFWEMYKEHLEPIVGPEDLENSRRAAGAFEAGMKNVIEAVPRYLTFSLKR